MAQPGWYADPAGDPSKQRYWDGTRWTHDTSDIGPKQRPKSPWAWVIAGIVIVVVIAVILALLNGSEPGARPAQEDSNSARPSGSVWNDQKVPSAPPIDAPTNGTLVNCPTSSTQSGDSYTNDGWLHGGGLKAKRIPGWKNGDVFMEWVHDMHAQTEVVVSSGSVRWFSMLALGALAVSDGFEQPKLSAFQVMSCFATSRYYQDFTGRKDVLSEAVTINGKPGWHLRSEVYVDMKQLPNIEGDWVDVIVVDTDNSESLGILLTSVTIGDDKRLDLIEHAIKSLQIDR